jgi:hypothetical protein
MAAIEQSQRDKLDVVLLNVDNPRWQPELDRFDVNGIPQLQLFDADGISVGRAVGARSAPELAALGEALIAQAPLPQLAGVGPTSPLESDGLLPGPANPATMASPRSHG